MATVSEWSGIASSSPIDASNGAPVESPSGTSFTTGSVTPTQSGDLVLSAVWVDNKNTGTGSAEDATSGYTALNETNAGGGYYRGWNAYQVDSGVSAITATWANVGTNSYDWVIAAFKP